MSDPGSLQNLNDIVLPAKPAFWPPAPGWYVVIVVVAAVLGWLLFRALKRWRRNTYRREALRELAEIHREGSAAARRLPELLKRTALSAWPRERVASLHGAEWHAFLDAAAATDDFGKEAGKVLDRLAYAGRNDFTPSSAEFERVCAAVEGWIRRHVAEDG